MTASDGDQRTSRNPPNSSRERPLSDARAATKHLIVNARVTYAPLVVWKHFHWTCTVTNFAPLVRDRSE